MCSNKQKGHFKKGNDMLGREWGCHLNTIVINLYTVVVFSLFLCVFHLFSFINIHIISRFFFARDTRENIFPSNYLNIDFIMLVKQK